MNPAAPAGAVAVASASAFAATVVPLAGATR